MRIKKFNYVMDFIVFILRGNQAKQQGIIGKYDMEDAVIQTNDRQMRAPIRVRMKDETKNTKYLTEKDYIYETRRISIKMSREKISIIYTQI